MKLVVTGATKGIGRAIAFRFAQEGFDVAFCARTAADVEAMKQELEAKFPNAQFVGEVVDMSSKEAVKSFGKKVQEDWGKVDVLINNAGVFLPCDLSDTSKEDAFELMMTTNVHSAYYMTHSFLSDMIAAKDGHVINMCSIASFMPYGAYAVSKHALLGFSRALREELKEKGVRVTAIMPGATLTASWDGVELPKERFMTAEDIAQSVWGCYELSKLTVVEEMILRPQLGDI